MPSVTRTSLTALAASAILAGVVLALLFGVSLIAFGTVGALVSQGLGLRPGSVGEGLLMAAGLGFGMGVAFGLPMPAYERYEREEAARASGLPVR